MTAWLGAAFLVVGFLVLCRMLGLIASARRVLGITTTAFTVMGDPTLDEDAREQAMQRHALSLFGLFFRLVAVGAIAVLVPLGLLWLADQTGSLPWEASLEVALSLRFIALISALSVIGWLLWKRIHPGTHQNQPGSDYSSVDRLLHRAAFASVPVQIALSGLEERLFRHRLAQVDPARPVFITGLPRSGTTLLLELCHQTGEFSAHTYRQMPFVLNPLLWERCSRRFRRDTTAHERAHGDGMLINVDSPEALEEMVWMAYWQTHYGAETIAPWSAAEEVAAFTDYFRRHMKKMLALAPIVTQTGVVEEASASKQKPVPRRYLSKNNLNIARIGWLRQRFPDARIIVPFREPREHAASLLRQHSNFLTRHREDSFTCEYMRALGHFDFGVNLRPVDFDDWWQTGRSLDPLTLDFWLAYWTAAYRALLREAVDPSVRLLDFDALCTTPEAGLRELAAFLELDHPQALVTLAPRLHRPEAHPTAMEQSINRDILDDAITMHETLRQQAAAFHITGYK